MRSLLFVYARFDSICLELVETVNKFRESKFNGRFLSDCTEGTLQKQARNTGCRLSRFDFTSC